MHAQPHTQKKKKKKHKKQEQLLTSTGIRIEINIYIIKFVLTLTVEENISLNKIQALKAITSFQKPIIFSYFFVGIAI